MFYWCVSLFGTHVSFHPTLEEERERESTLEKNGATEEKARSGSVSADRFLAREDDGGSRVGNHRSATTVRTSSATSSCQPTRHK
ncbi:hypothetical protein HanIR_Chr01g0030201 [Helianthus annuus]|nr:hypothetical protein HanIR_Chr01g0030201 [Helianthus annuus]